VRNPLNGLLGFTQLLRQSPLSDLQRNQVEQVSRCGATIHKIISDMLDFSRLEVNPATLEAKPFDPQQVVREVVEMLSSVAQQKGLPVVVECQASRVAVGDALRIQQVLLNFLGNALKFTDQGQVTVRCSTVPTAAGQDTLHVEVQDSGIGIAPDAVGQLFQPFSPVSEKTIRQYGGTGLGLAICKRLVDVMQGQIGVMSQPGQGSCFWFEVPLRVVD
jgi:signal transduction histidine kinase